MKTKATRRGFTLIELLVVITIIAILISIAAFSYRTVTKKSRDSSRKSAIEQLRSALEMYRSDKGYYPPTASGLWTNVSNLSTELVDNKYLSTLPSDPNGSTTTPYRYQATNLVSGNYYGYCLEANLETENPTDACTPEATYNYGAKNP